MKDEALINMQNCENRINGLLKQPPNHSAWSHQKTVEFKDVCKKAMQYMNRKRKNLEQLNHFESQLKTYFQ